MKTKIARKAEFVACEGKIMSAKVGRVDDVSNYFGLHLGIKWSRTSSIGKVKTTTSLRGNFVMGTSLGYILNGEHAEYLSVVRDKELLKAMRFIEQLLRDAKVPTVDKLVGVPVIMTNDDIGFKVLQEAIVDDVNPYLVGA